MYKENGSRFYRTNDLLEAVVKQDMSRDDMEKKVKKDLEQHQHNLKELQDNLDQKRETKSNYKLSWSSGKQKERKKKNGQRERD